MTRLLPHPLKFLYYLMMIIKIVSHIFMKSGDSISSDKASKLIQRFFSKESRIFELLFIDTAITHFFFLNYIGN